jgi:serine/threonine-protein kinase
MSSEPPIAGPPTSQTWDSRATVRDPTDEPEPVDVDLDVQPALELRGTLGEGGMGVVHLALQRSLDREVAVKTVREAMSSPLARTRLLREAVVTGSLEHPNIVPVYDLGRDDEGLPRLVLKRIEGALWSELLADPFAVRERFAARDAVQWHLRILVQLCNAVAFAHDRGVIHRDLKPENVMIGSYGEVYLLDWGLALGLDEQGRARSERSGDTSFSGSPAYLAPEQLGGTGHALGRHTDIYLLGSMLYEILHGHPPHLGTTLSEVLASVRRSDPVIEPGLPAALQQLMRRCFALDPADRPPSAEAVRDALSDYLERRHADEVVDQAVQQLSALREALAGDADPVVLHDRLGAARFGFRQALQIDPEHPGARRGLIEALTAMADWAIERDELSAAGLWLDELGDDAPADAIARLEQARARRAKTAARQQRIARKHDATIDAAQRLRWLVVLAASWCAVPVLAYLPLGTAPTYRGSLWAFALLAVLGLAVVGAWWRAEATQANRNLPGVAGIAPLSVGAATLTALGLGLSASGALTLTLYSWAVLSMLGLVWYGPGIVTVPIAYGLAVAASVRWPEWGPVHWALANANFGVAMVLYRLPTVRAALRR